MRRPLPEIGKTRQDDQAKTILVGQPRVLNLPEFINHLLVQNGIFSHQVRLAAGQVC
jgi:hypothetical protein